MKIKLSPLQQAVEDQLETEQRAAYEKARARLRDMPWVKVSGGTYIEQETPCHKWGGEISKGMTFPRIRGDNGLRYSVRRLIFTYEVHEISKGFNINTYCNYPRCCNVQHFKMVSRAKEALAASLAAQAARGYPSLKKARAVRIAKEEAEARAQHIKNLTQVAENIRIRQEQAKAKEKAA